MTPAVVVDAGNSFFKWGRVAGDRLGQVLSLPLENEAEWESVAWAKAEPWLIAGVVPRAIARLTDWLTRSSRTFSVLDNDRFLKAATGFRTEVEEPQRIGIDRLLNAYAAHRLSPGFAVAVISIGTATTLDYVTADGVHRGGAILPGPALMTQALNEHTAKLPKVEIGRYQPEMLFGVNTEQAIHLGITRAIIGAAESLINDWAGEPMNVVITGGGHKLFRDYLFAGRWNEVFVEPHLPLEGLRRIADLLP